MNKSSISILCMILSFVVLGACLSGCDRKEDILSFNTEYQAVFMDNGQVFFGKLEKGGSDHPLLREVYYIGKQQTADAKDPANILLKRGGEWHGPEYMYITKIHIAMIEPVSPTSRVAELIKALKAKQPEEKPAK